MSNRPKYGYVIDYGTHYVDFIATGWIDYVMASRGVV